MLFQRLLRKTLIPDICRRYFYEQGQISSSDNVREYFYFIDHQGMLFLDDAKMKNFTSCFKEKHFLSFFFRRIKKNTTGKYLENGFNFISPCGPEINFIRCEDTPIVFTHIVPDDDEDLLLYNHGNEKLNVSFNPENIYMVPSSGRIYYPTQSKKKFGPAGLISDKLSIAWNEEERFIFKYGDNGPPSHFRWRGTVHKLNKSLAPELKN
ncbi:UPF0598 protein CG30010 [Lepeophtheirus salmonis]|uniref:UPF0598 protein CG30010 n=1 Tax=Lepeophtheirus salmonis TaxID=72036 RepID=UPI001AE1C772|nr:UPF0598 protein CG30010-like [Lepeophtheirus salmonis]